LFDFGILVLKGCMLTKGAHLIPPKSTLGAIAATSDIILRGVYVLHIGKRVKVFFDLKAYDVNY